MRMKNTMIKVDSIISKESYLDSDNIAITEMGENDTTLTYTTRDNGSVGEEEYGQEDYAHANNIKKRLLAEFKDDDISAEVNTCNEWVSLTVSFK